VNLNESISLYSKTQSRAANGTLTTTRTLVATVYAKTRPMSGNERSRSDQSEGYADYRFYIHQRSDLSEANIIVWNSTDYNIKFIADNGPKEPYMYIDAERGGAQ